MKKILFLLGALATLLFVSCASTSVAPMYNWDNYASASYKYMKYADKASLDELIAVYENIIAGQEKTTRQTVPPGICADYGYFLLKAGKINEGKAMLRKELELYPESKKYVERIMGAI